MAEDRIAADVRELELALLSSGVRSSLEQVGLLLADDFLEFGSSGRVLDKRQVIDGLRAEPVQRRAAEDVLVRTLAEDVVLVTYRGVRSVGEGDREFRTLRSSIWRRVGGRWRMVFHQGTPVGRSDR